MAKRYVVRKAASFDVIDTETPAPSDEPAHPDGRIVFNTRDRNEAQRIADEHEALTRASAEQQPTR